MIRGVFSKSGLQSLFASKRLLALPSFEEKHVSSASVDLTTTGEAYRVERLLTPSQLANERVRELLPKMGATPISVGSVMEVGCTYVVKASLDINFPPGMYGYLNAKSTSGRNFLFARSIADGVHMFDCVDKRREGYSGELWIVLQPLAYPIVLTDKECYNQLRVFDGDTRFDQSDLEGLLQTHDLLYRRETTPYKQGELSLFTHDGSVLCTLYAKPNEIIGYKAKKTTKPLDLSFRGVNPREYFEPVYAECLHNESEGVVHVESGRYYLLATNEALKIPEHTSAELKALDTRLGFFFTHFAGFFDPGFFGTATLEVFAPHDEFLRHKKPIARFEFERLKEQTVSYALSGNYEGQIRTQLPKQFTSW